MRSRIAVSLSLALLVLAQGCSTGGGPDDGGSSSFTADIQPIFNEFCVLCHEGGDLDLTPALSYSELVGIMSSGYVLTRVQPNDSENSLLYQKVEGNAYGGRMPMNAEPLSEGRIESIRLWIDEGALAN